MQVQHTDFARGKRRFGRSQSTEQSTTAVRARIENDSEQMQNNSGSLRDLISLRNTKGNGICNVNDSDEASPTRSDTESGFGSDGGGRRYQQQFCQVSANKKNRDEEHAAILSNVPRSCADLDGKNGKFEAESSILGQQNKIRKNSGERDFCDNNTDNTGNQLGNVGNNKGALSVQRGHPIYMDTDTKYTKNQQFQLGRVNEQLGRFDSNQLGRFDSEQLGRVDKYGAQHKRLGKTDTKYRKNQQFQLRRVDEQLGRFNSEQMGRVDECGEQHKRRGTTNTQCQQNDADSESSGETATASSIAVLADQLGVDMCKRDTAEMTPRQVYEAGQHRDDIASSTDSESRGEHINYESMASATSTKPTHQMPKTQIIPRYDM